jgi:hypothetical protein
MNSLRDGTGNQFDRNRESIRDQQGFNSPQQGIRRKRDPLAATHPNCVGGMAKWAPLARRPRPAARCMASENLDRSRAVSDVRICSLKCKRRIRRGASGRRLQLPFDTERDTSATI